MDGEAGGVKIRDWAYDYDALQRLDDATQGTVDTGTLAITGKESQQQWSLDHLGNWLGFRDDANGDGVFTGASDLDQDRSHNAANEITDIDEVSGQVEWEPVSYDAAGNMIHSPHPIDPMGDLGVEYDAWNRMVLSQGENVYVEYAYDGLHRRILKEPSNQGMIPVHYYLNEQWQEIEERTTTSGPATKQFIWGATYIDELVLRDRDADANGTSLEERLYALYDALYSVTCVVNASGVVQERFAYSPYGESTVLNADFSVKSGGSSIDWQHRFTGRRRDPETGLQLNRYRYYHAGLGRWVTRDPVGYSAGDANLYGYVLGQPTYWVDPTGEYWSIWPSNWGKPKPPGGGGGSKPPAPRPPTQSPKPIPRPPSNAPGGKTPVLNPPGGSGTVGSGGFPSGNASTSAGAADRWRQLLRAAKGSQCLACEAALRALTTGGGTPATRAQLQAILAECVAKGLIK